LRSEDSEDSKGEVEDSEYSDCSAWVSKERRTVIGEIKHAPMLLNDAAIRYTTEDE